MSENKLQKHFKPNVVYKLLIHGVYPYVGCHCSKKDYLTENRIIESSGNYLWQCLKKKIITRQEYFESIELIQVWEFDTPEKALDFEEQKIREIKEEYGVLCKNKALFGNRHSNKGCEFFKTEEYRKKQSEKSKGRIDSPETRMKRSIALKGRLFSEETKRKMSEAKKGRKQTEEQKKMRSTAMKGRYWFNNGVKSIMAYECPEGFHPGRIPRRKKS